MSRMGITPRVRGAGALEGDRLEGGAVDAGCGRSDHVQQGRKTPRPQQARANAVRPRRENNLRVPVGTDSRWEHGGNRRPLTRPDTQDALRRFGFHVERGAGSWL